MRSISLDFSRLGLYRSLYYGEMLSLTQTFCETGVEVVSFISQGMHYGGRMYDILDVLAK